MSPELIEIRSHLMAHEPFDELPEAVVDEIASQVEIAYFRAGTDILLAGNTGTHLHYIRSGAVETFRRTGELYSRLSEGDVFGQFSLLLNRTVRYPARALEDSLIYRIPKSMFQKLWDDYDSFADFVELEDRTRLRSAVQRNVKANEQMTARVTRLIVRSPVTAPETSSIRDCARIMSEQRVSSLLLIDDSQDPPQMCGVITDRDLRDRALAVEINLEDPVHTIMTRELITVDSDAFVFEAMLSMLHNHVHHLPVVERGQPRGVVSLSDIVRYQSQSALFVVNSIYNESSLAGLKRLTTEVRASFVRMVMEDANSEMIGSAMAGIGRAFSRRLLELAEEELGPPPVPYCFMALGSMARDEQSVVTDQDNALVLDDRFDPALHDDYFRKLAEYVSHGLDSCGYTYCTGEIMASNIRWRQPLSVWKGYFREWMEKPKAQALLNSNIFFDLDGIAGELSLAEELKQLIASEAPKNRHFLAMMARNALNRTPPLGFFRTFVLEKDGRQDDSINLKRRGTAPLSDLIRIHALALGTTAQNSHERLRAIGKTQLLPEKSSEDLRDALEFLSMVRIRSQVRAIDEGREPDNRIRPADLSPFERRTLKDAFEVLSSAQKFLRMRYQNLPNPVTRN